MVHEKDLMVALKRHWAYAGGDEDIAHETATTPSWSFPNPVSGFDGVENFRQWRREHPAHLSLIGGNQKSYCAISPARYVVRDAGCGGK
jgi:hypothetical protein